MDRKQRKVFSLSLSLLSQHGHITFIRQGEENDQNTLETPSYNE